MYQVPKGVGLLKNKCRSGKTRGTCDDSRCKFHGFCHCGCGTKARLSSRSSKPLEREAGRPFIYRSGHHPATRDNAAEAARVSHLADVPVEPVRALVRLLIRAAGSREKASAAAGISDATLSGVLYKPVKVVRPQTAQAVEEAVRALLTRPISPIWESRAEPPLLLFVSKRDVRDPDSERDRLFQAKRREAYRRREQQKAMGSAGPRRCSTRGCTTTLSRYNPGDLCGPCEYRMVRG